MITSRLQAIRGRALCPSIATYFIYEKENGPSYIFGDWAKSRQIAGRKCWTKDCYVNRCSAGEFFESSRVSVEEPVSAYLVASLAAR